MELVNMKGVCLWLLTFLILASCVPKEQVVFRAVENIELTPGNGIDPILKADARFYNPNQIRMRLKEIEMDIYIDGKKSARVDQKLKSLVKARSEFTVPVEVQLSIKEIGLVDALMSLIGGKKYELHYVGHIKVAVRGFPVKIPVDYKREVRLRL
ncbi:MAG: LEA type 2 family protein [Cyclobacteriaceae bacterium]|nr:LEA type 2 family protein [Cyclobacteriaceae bacterium]